MTDLLSAHQKPHKSPQPLWAWLSSFILLAFSILGGDAWFEYQGYIKSEGELIRYTAESVGQQIQLVMDKTMQSLELFVLEEGALLSELSKKSTTDVQLGKTVENRLALILSGSFAFAVLNLEKKSFFLSEKTVKLKEFPLLKTASGRVLGCLEHSDTLEFSVYWLHHATQGFLLICESLDVIAQLLKSNQNEAFELLLVHNREPRVLATKQGTRTNLGRSSEFSLSEHQESLYQQPIVGGPWHLVALPNKTIFHRTLFKILLDNALLFILFCALYGFLIYRLFRANRKRARFEAELRLSAIVFESSFEGIMITDATGRIMRVNKSFSKITGYLPEEVIGKNASMLKSGRHGPDFYKEMWRNLLEHGFWHGEIWNQRKNGSIYPQRLSISVITDAQGHVSNYIAIFADITEKKQIEERIHRLAYYDELTDLPNRVLFQERLKRALIHAKRNQLAVSLLFLDLDRFKSINDSMGHPAGDKLLEIAAKRLKTCIREEDTVARMGGDEFTLILVGMKPGERAKQGARLVAEKVLETLSGPFQVWDREVFVGVSIGIAFYPDDAQEPMELVKNADLALYHAKNQGRNNFQYYTEDMNLKAIDRLELENDLRRAIQLKEFCVYYQPQISLLTGELCGMEGLLRWQSPTRGLLTPSEFVSMLDETGLIVPIGEWSLRTICMHAAHWLKLGYMLPRVAVNLSARQFVQPQVVDLVKTICTETGFPINKLELELTESVLIEDVESTIETLKHLKALGVQISIDDFGTGYSSLNYLKRFPIDRLKIDRSFVRDITVDPDSAEVITAIIAIAHNLKLGVIAEGVETEAQLEFLRFHHCDEIQGYFISPPLPEASVAQMLKGKIR